MSKMIVLSVEAEKLLISITQWSDSFMLNNFKINVVDELATLKSDTGNFDFVEIFESEKPSLNELFDLNLIEVRVGKSRNLSAETREAKAIAIPLTIYFRMINESLIKNIIE